MNVQRTVTAMDVDCPIVSLKRSSSAPMINEISATMSITSPSTSAPREAVSTFNVFSNTPRTRRFSTSSPGSIPRLTPRVSQLRQEECVDVAGREAAHEKEIHSAMQISQSWEDLTLEAEGLSFKDSESPTQQLNKLDKQTAKRVFDPLSLNLPVSGGPPLCSSPSPTRSGIGQRQCYSPGIHMVNWKSSLSPSPTRKAFATRRSLSPIAIRPSCLGPVKRKFELDDNSSDYLQPPAKRTSTLVISNSPRLDAISSPLPGTISSAGTPESLSSVDSPSFSFRPVDSPSPGRLVTNGDEPMSETNEQTKMTTDRSQSEQIDQCNHRNKRRFSVLIATCPKVPQLNPEHIPFILYHETIFRAKRSYLQLVFFVLSNTDLKLMDALEERLITMMSSHGNQFFKIEMNETKTLVNISFIGSKVAIIGYRVYQPEKGLMDKFLNFLERAISHPLSKAR